ncbi:phosphate ABC transporter permease subunit PstC [Levilactobacillus acidifarinae]|uniref:Phosphate transport system permease protein n=1 Tax=Levilactobacillus acidifarinae DSM 19394 = JCM 15949 TaxID=1423715 RepID=A0A0R1LE94_9LACO|nr:phosphate ABC transporter permease subunit PstC [Levilactobacillus acidifarinae]KRK94012.1 ABC-type phosphate transport system, permease component [Levilactobacillus acidifarinae DSM 19394]GEO68899.1 phosphate transport system permease protein [Levilactobacillus acidifarinae]
MEQTSSGFKQEDTQPKDWAQQLHHATRATREDWFGRGISYLCIGVIILVVASMLWFITSKGIATFTHNHVNVGQFLTGTNWAPDQGKTGALPMIIGSFAVTFAAAIVATPFAVGTAIFMTEIAPKRGRKVLQPVIELLVGIPSVVYGFIGLAVVVPFMRHLVGGSGFGIISATFVLFVMVLPTITTMTVDSLRAVPRFYKEASLALGATRWQTVSRVILRAATPGILTAIIFGMARAFGEALAVQMVIGNAAIMPKNLISPASTLTSQLTTGIGDTIDGTLPNNALWSLALILLLMSLFFNALVRIIAKRGQLSHER